MAAHPAFFLSAGKRVAVGLRALPPSLSSTSALSSTTLVPHRAPVDHVGRRSNQGEHDTHRDTHHQR